MLKPDALNDDETVSHDLHERGYDTFRSAISSAYIHILVLSSRDIADVSILQIPAMSETQAHDIQIGMQQDALVCDFVCISPVFRLPVARSPQSDSHPVESRTFQMPPLSNRT